jgi:hypothetical protein
MANEIKLTTSIAYTNGTLKDTWAPGTINIPQATKGIDKQTITATTAEADHAVTVGTQGMMVLHSLEATTTGNTLNWCVKSSTGGIATNYFVLKPKRMAMVELGSTTMVIRYRCGTESATATFGITTYSA